MIRSTETTVTLPRVPTAPPPGDTGQAVLVSPHELAQALTADAT